MLLLRALMMLTISLGLPAHVANAEEPSLPIDFNRDVRPILSDSCFRCHGPDAGQRKGLARPLRLDTEEGARADLGGYAAIVPGNVEESELIRRVASDDANEVMPPRKTGKPLSPSEVETLSRWVQQGAPYARHWSYEPPRRPPLPAVKDASWPRNPIDRFVLARLDREGLSPAPEADRAALIRRVALDLTGLPPSPEDVKRFLADDHPNAYERLVDDLLARPSYGEHWGRFWLDIARYADSSGYADDPPRTIWAYRDHVIRAFNANTPFDRFTIDQIAGDLLPDPTDDQLIATAFHRNTMTNNEGGTSDEEFRNVAVVDRVNTTMAAWMGTTIACAQCHDHKYDPLPQKDYYRLFAFFNNTQDADRADEAPVLGVDLPETKARKAAQRDEIALLEAKILAPTAESAAGQAAWEAAMAADPVWTALEPSGLTAREGASLELLEDDSILAKSASTTDVYTIHAPLTRDRLTALRLEALPDASLPSGGPGYGGGNFVISKVSVAIAPPGDVAPVGRYLRVDLPGKGRILSLAEVQVFRGAANIATNGIASQSSTAFDAPANLAIDGTTDGRFLNARSTTHTDLSDNPWWEVDLRDERPVDRVTLWNRTDNSLQARLSGAVVSLFTEDRRMVWTDSVAMAPQPFVELAVSRERPIALGSAFADYEQPGFAAANVLGAAPNADRGWAIGGAQGQAHALTIVPEAPVEVLPGSTLRITIEQTSNYESHTLGRFRLAMTGDANASAFSRTPPSIFTILRTTPEHRTETQRAALTRYYLEFEAPEHRVARDRLAALRQDQAASAPDTTVPIFRELPTDQTRVTRVHLRGNFLDPGDEVTAGVPDAFPPLSSDAPADRLALARWLVSAENPLTARVLANRYWEQIFGTGLVASSEDFGSQGDLPSHPELLDWLATELVREGWDLKAFLRMLVTSASYRQSSRVTPEAAGLDPDNRLIARGPRLRLSAETIRDQALAVSGLLSPKMFGPPVKPPQPSSGLSAAFGGKIDWETSPGEDRHRRGLYTSWRRSNPYPSMATFDAPNREVCTLRRSRTNTPLQALVTLNDPVYVEAAQSLARLMTAAGPDPSAIADLGFRRVLVRPPTVEERDRLVALFRATQEDLENDQAAARMLATDPLGPTPPGANVVDLAAWTVVANVILNLDETLMKP